VTGSMYVRQCQSCGIIDGRTTFDSEDEASAQSTWRCEHCGHSAFQAVVMVDDEPSETPDDEYV
jgi:hypothetical protein